MVEALILVLGIAAGVAAGSAAVTVQSLLRRVAKLELAITAKSAADTQIEARARKLESSAHAADRDLATLASKAGIARYDASKAPK